MNAELYSALKAERELVKTRLLELNKLINRANKDFHFEPLTYSQFGEAVEYWYNAYNHSLNAYNSLNRASKIAWSSWKQHYNEFIATGKSSHIYTDCVMSGMKFEEAFIKDWNEGPQHYIGGSPTHRRTITGVTFERTPNW